MSTGWIILNIGVRLFLLNLGNPLPRALQNNARERSTMDVQALLLPWYERDFHDAASFLPLLVALAVPLVSFRLLIVALSALLKPATSAHSHQIQSPHGLLTLFKHGLSLQRLR